MATRTNHLLQLLPAPERSGLLACCEAVSLSCGETLHAADGEAHHAFFPLEGFISVIASIESHPGLGIGMVGREGMFGAHLALGRSREPQGALVHGAGRAWRIAHSDLRSELARSEVIRSWMHGYVAVWMAQLAVSAACLRFHEIGPRLARWFLMGQDRAQSQSIRITHEALSSILGVRRVGITVAANALQRSGLILYHRGEVKVVSRSRLLAAACSCYAAESEIYRIGMNS